MAKLNNTKECANEEDLWARVTKYSRFHLWDMNTIHVCFQHEGRNQKDKKARFTHLTNRLDKGHIHFYCEVARFYFLLEVSEVLKNRIKLMFMEVWS